MESAQKAIESATEVTNATNAAKESSETANKAASDANEAARKANEATQNIEQSLKNKQDKQDDSLETEAKTVAGAINELQEKQTVLPSTSGKAGEFLEGSSDGTSVWTPIFNVGGKLLARSNMGPINSGDDLDGIVTPGTYYSKSASS